MSKASRSRSVKFSGRAKEVDTTKASAERRIANIGGMLRIWASSRKSGDVEAEGTRETNQARLILAFVGLVLCLFWFKFALANLYLIRNLIRSTPSAETHNANLKVELNVPGRLGFVRTDKQIICDPGANKTCLCLPP